LRWQTALHVSYEAHEFDRSDFEPHEQIVITLSKAGYIKRIPASTYRNQHRGGKGVTGMNMKEDDPVEHILVIDTHDRLLFFTNTGRVLSLTSYELRADTARNTRGVPIANVIALKENETVRAVFEVKDLNQEDTFLIMATRTGKIEKVPLQEISSIRLSGLIVMNLKPKDELVSVRLAQNNNDLIMVSEQGMSIRFSVEALTSHHRGAGGVRGMKLREKDKVIAMNVGIPESRLLVISKNGYGKVTPLENYRTQNRGGTGVKTSNITKKTGVIASAQVVSDDKEVYIVSKKAPN
jgi:Type IIA topoisomerase (DNA gyrase/topo II, topoisomerase IV), A subunit